MLVLADMTILSAMGSTTINPAVATGNVQDPGNLGIASDRLRSTIKGDTTSAITFALLRGRGGRFIFANWTVRVLGCAVDPDSDLGLPGHV